MSLPDERSPYDGTDWVPSEQPSYTTPRLPDPIPVPRRSVAKTVGGALLAVLTVLFVMGLLVNIAHGTFHPFAGGRGLGQLIGAVLCIGLPAWGAQRLLTSHSRELADWEEKRRQQQLTRGW